MQIRCYEQTIMQRGRCRKSFGAGICICAGYRLLLMVNIITASFKNNVIILNYSLWKLTNRVMLLLNDHIEAMGKYLLKYLTLSNLL